MANAPRDNNQVPTILGTSNADGITPLKVYVNPTTHVLQIDDCLLNTDLSDDIAKRDENRVPVIMAVSSDDGVTPIPIYVDSSTNKLCTQST